MFNVQRQSQLLRIAIPHNFLEWLAFTNNIYHRAKYTIGRRAKMHKIMSENHTLVFFTTATIYSYEEHGKMPENIDWLEPIRIPRKYEENI